MIIDPWPDDNSSHPGFKHPPPVTQPPVARCITPSPSLPAYESTETLLKRESSHHKPNKSISLYKPRHRCCTTRIVVYCLIVYFFLTVVIGVPLLVIKLRPHSQLVTPTTSGTYYQSNVASPSNLDVQEWPVDLSSSCNAWNYTGKDTHAGLYGSFLQYSLPLNPAVSLFLRSNVSHVSNSPHTNPISGSLHVVVTEDASASDVLVSVNMSYTNERISNKTSVCYMDMPSMRGVYIYVPNDVASPDHLSFNITLALPRNTTSSQMLPDFTSILSGFTQHIDPLAPAFWFQNALVGGLGSSITIDSIQAKTLTVQSTNADIRGTFNVSDSLYLDTTFGSIYADIALTSYTKVVNGNATCIPTFLGLGSNATAINANVTLMAELTSAYPPNFYITAGTCDQPLNLAVAHDPNSAPAVLQLSAVNSRAANKVRLDERLLGSYSVQTYNGTLDGEQY